MNKTDIIFKNNSDIESFSRGYINHLINILSLISEKQIKEFVDTLMKAREVGSTIYFAGNGGSAATASHFANDIGIGTKPKNKYFRAVSLCENQSVITAIANDYGYEYIFSKQLEVVINKNDVLVLISASGNSKNLLLAAELAKLKGATTVGLTAFNGGDLAKLVDVSVHIPTEVGEYGVAEDAHMVLDHLISNYLMRFLKK
jgi:D-sedoheptulose 7-phosphate isomerase